DERRHLLVVHEGEAEVPPDDAAEVLEELDRPGLVQAVTALHLPPVLLTDREVPGERRDRVTGGSLHQGEGGADDGEEQRDRLCRSPEGVSEDAVHAALRLLRSESSAV